MKVSHLWYDQRRTPTSRWFKLKCHRALVQSDSSSQQSSRALPVASSAVVLVLCRVREGGEATRYFCIAGTAIRWLLLLLLILTLRSQGELTTAFVVSSLGLSYTFSQTNFSLILEVSRNLCVHSLHLQALVNVNIAFWILRSDQSIQGS